MNNFSENGMLPIMDGLICWLDGRDGRTGDTVWKDRVKPKEYTINNGGIEENLKSCALKTGGFLNLGLIGNGEKTFEIRYKKTDTKYWSAIMYVLNKVCVEMTSANKILFRVQNNDTPTSTLTLSKSIENCILTVSVGSEVCIYIDGVLETKLSSDFFAKYGYIISDLLMFDSDYLINSRFDGGDKQAKNIYSFKIYNRVLTEEEIQHNYLYEQSIERGE